MRFTILTLCVFGGMESLAGALCCLTAHPMANALIVGQTLLGVGTIKLLAVVGISLLQNLKVA